MSNVTYFTDHQSALENIKGVSQNTTAYIDFAAKSVSASDTVNLLRIPAGAIVRGINCVIVTAEGATCTMAVGDGTTADLFDASVNLNAAAATMTGSDVNTETTLAATNGKYYAADGYIVGTMGHDTDAAQLYVSADYILLNKAHA